MQGLQCTIMIHAIFVDAGHGLGPTGGIDNGASGNGTTERQEVVEIATELIKSLRSDPALSTVEIIPIGVESRMMLKDKIAEANAYCREHQWSAEHALLVSIHLNATTSPTARGLEAWYSKQKPAARYFAQCILNQVSSRTGIPLRPTTLLTSDANRWGRLGILDDTIATGCLVECGFITNEFDAKVLKDASLDDRFAEGIHRGIREYLSLSAAPTLGTPSTTTVSTPPAPPTSAPQSGFIDIPELAWYNAAVKMCLEQGIFRPSADGRFHPERPVTRAELAMVIARHLTSHHGSH